MVRGATFGWRFFFVYFSPITIIHITMAQLKYLVIHCTATPEGRKVTKADIEKWHLKERGWKVVGYSDMIHLDGTLENLVPFNQDDHVDPWEVTNGAKGYNGIARHVVYVGGSAKTKEDWMAEHPPKDTRTTAQKATLVDYVRYMLRRHPGLKVIGHNQISNKACPSFDVADWLMQEDATFPGDTLLYEAILWT